MLNRMIATIFQSLEPMLNNQFSALDHIASHRAFAPSTSPCVCFTADCLSCLGNTAGPQAMAHTFSVFTSIDNLNDDTLHGVQCGPTLAQQGKQSSGNNSQWPSAACNARNIKKSPLLIGQEALRRAASRRKTQSCMQLGSLILASITSFL